MSRPGAAFSTCSRAMPPPFTNDEEIDKAVADDQPSAVSMRDAAYFEFLLVNPSQGTIRHSDRA